MTELSPSVDAATILIVEDEIGLQTLAAHALRREGFHVLVAADMEEARHVSAACQTDIHLILTDLMLPSGTGIALARDLLASRPTTTLLYMSGLGPDAIQNLYFQGAPQGEFLAKPFLPRELVARIRTLLAQRASDLEATKPSQVLPTPAAAISALNADAEYRLESSVRCPRCGDTITTLRAVRLLRVQVNFTSTLPRRGRVLVCPSCLVLLTGELTNF